MNGMLKTQFDHVYFELLPLVIWSRMFWPPVMGNLRKPQRWRKSVLTFHCHIGFWGEGKTGVPGEKPLGAKERTNQLNPNMASMPEFEPGSHWWEVSALTSAPPLTTRSQTQFPVISGCLLTVFDFFHELLIGTLSYYRVVQSTRKVGYFNDFPLISSQVTDMMQKALFDYMKHKFSGR